VPLLHANARSLAFTMTSCEQLKDYVLPTTAAG